MNNQVNDSIIIPHKNNLELLRRCLLSIPARSDVQRIVVDDCSAQSTVKELLKLEDKSTKIILTTENKGAGYARNIGLKNAVGEWIVFADSDDTFETEQLSIAMSECLCDEKTDVIYFDVNCYDSTTGKFSDDLNEQYKRYLFDRNDCENLCRYKIRAPWGKFIRKTLIDKYDIRFSEVPVSNDLIFSLKIGYYASCVMVYKQLCVYNYFVWKSSLTAHSKLNYSLLKVHIQTAYERNEFIESHHIPIKYRTNYFYILPAVYRTNKIEAIKTFMEMAKKTPIRYLFQDIFKVTIDFFRHTNKKSK